MKTKTYKHLIYNYSELPEKLGQTGQITQIWVEHGAQPPYLHIIFETEDGTGLPTHIGGYVEETAK